MKKLQAYGLIPPSAYDLEQAYKRYGIPHSSERMPCSRGVKNQCAVRMSVALSRAKGQDVLEYYQSDSLHGAQCCAGPDPYPHIASAQTLFNHIKQVLGFKFELVVGGKASLLKRKGIVFFDGISTAPRKDKNGVPTGALGDHIDFWNGKSYMNDALGTGEPGSDLHLFEDSRKTWFCQL